VLFRSVTDGRSCSLKLVINVSVADSGGSAGILAKQCHFRGTYFLELMYDCRNQAIALKTPLQVNERNGDVTTANRHQQPYARDYVRQPDGKVLPAGIPTLNVLEMTEGEVASFICRCKLKR
jgi:hypothetical protein